MGSNPSTRVAQQHALRATKGARTTSLDNWAEKTKADSRLARSALQLHAEGSPFKELCSESTDDLPLSIHKLKLAYPLKAERRQGSTRSARRLDRVDGREGVHAADDLTNGEMALGTP